MIHPVVNTISLWQRDCSLFFPLIKYYYFFCKGEENKPQERKKLFFLAVLSHVHDLALIVLLILHCILYFIICSRAFDFPFCQTAMWRNGSDCAAGKGYSTLDGDFSVVSFLFFPL